MKKPNVVPPLFKVIKLDPSVSLLMLSTPPGNPGGMMAPPSGPRKRHEPLKGIDWGREFGGE